MKISTPLVYRSDLENLSSTNIKAPQSFLQDTPQILDSANFFWLTYDEYICQVPGLRHGRLVSHTTRFHSVSFSLYNVHYCTLSLAPPISKKAGIQ